MKKIMIVALYESISQYYRQHLYDIFGGMVEVEYYYIENNEKEFHFDGDLIVASSNILFEHVKKLNRNNIETIVMRRTFTKEGFEKLKSMDVNTEMYFISTFHEIAVECISKLYELGIQNIRLIPYNPKLDRSGQGTDSVTAVVAGDTREIPSFIEKTIDIGDRAIDLSTIADIGTVLKLPAQSLYQILERYKKRLVYSDYGISKVIDTSTDIKRQLRTILNISNDSIIATDLNGIISEYNDNSQKTFGIPRSQVIGKKLDEIFPEIVIDDIIQKKEAVTNDLVTIQNITYVIDKHGIYDEEDQLTSIVIFCQKYMELENQQSKLRSKMIPSGHVARYTMDHIQGDSQIIKDLKPIARKMARSSSTVLVTGESGTGKEVFAQAIHNASDRANKPFIVVNCSALSPSLLESELFGYEEGAFTGAKKGGKIGMFEMADKGTIFLDEIGEMPYELQAKLLRVLMEREVMRVGGIDVIKVDVRVIAATNKNLLKLIEEGQFREDLYYRINVLPLPLPALRERKEDIPILA